MDDETIEVVRSEDDGNIAPPEPTTESTPSEPTEPVVEETTPTESTTELFELPDGRKVDAETLSREWKENFYPDYTRKSQALKQKEQETINKPDKVDPEWEPQSYEELLQVAEERALRAIEAKTQAQIQAQQELENAVISQLEEVKQVDPTVNENALFLHATKYGFRDLKLAYQNMKDMSEMAKKVQASTVANIAKRSDPVSVTPGANGAKLDPSQFKTARDYLRAIKGNM